jgi:hypothetical protein
VINADDWDRLIAAVEDMESARGTTAKAEDDGAAATPRAQAKAEPEPE